jgi:archaellum component FlaG (FlaF/FlaG flagellin family)
LAFVILTGDSKIKVSTLIIAIIAVGIALTVATTALLSPSTLNIPSDGIVQPSATPTATPTATPSAPPSTPVETLNVQVFNDEACTQECTSISWGTIAPGGQTSKTVYVKNTGSVSANLNMTTSGLTPPAAVGKIWVTWDSEGIILPADNVRTAILTLHADASLTDVTNFNINIVITGTQA